jgi:hypothetical protein
MARQDVAMKADLAMRAKLQGIKAGQLPLFVLGLSSANRRYEGQIPASLTTPDLIAISDARKNVAENVPRLILFDAGLSLFHSVLFEPFGQFPVSDI